MYWRLQSMDDLMAWLDENNPELSNRIGPMGIAEGGDVICKEYGITPPKGADLLDESMKYILKELKAHAKES